MNARRTPILATLAGAALLALSSAPAVLAVEPEPILSLFSHHRLVQVEAYADPNDDLPPSQLGPQSGPWMLGLTAAATGQTGNFANALSDQDSDATDFEYSGVGSVDAIASASSEDGAAATTISTYIMIFQPLNDTPFYLRVDLDSSTSELENYPSAKATLRSLNTTPDPVMIDAVSDATNGFEREQNAYVGILRAGILYQLTVQATAGAFVSNGESKSSKHSFDFEFTVRDTDCDGLLDIWEIEKGVDIDGDGSINGNDIPLVDAEKDQKDIFIEYDAMAGFEPPSGSLQLVENAFADVPPNLAQNPDNSQGINLHFVNGGDTVTGSSPWTNEWVAYRGARDINFGLPSERPPAANADDADKLRDARQLTHRYCVFAAEAASNSSGRAEPTGDDMMIFQGEINSGTPSDNDRRIKATAGTVMHEIGHMLGLAHGGGDDIPFKPNYMSVMNWALQVPSTDAPNAWHLDFSRVAHDTLDEEELVEAAGFGASGAPYDAWHTYWNSAEGDNAPHVLHDPAEGVKNWDGDNDPGEPGTVQRDINYLIPDPPPDQSLQFFIQDPSPDQSLVGHNDWASIILLQTSSDSYRWEVTGDVSSLPTTRNTDPGPVEPPMTALVALVDHITIGAPSCPADVTGDGIVDGADLATLLAQWGGAGTADFDSSGIVDGADLAVLLAAWGACQ